MEEEEGYSVYWLLPTASGNVIFILKHYTITIFLYCPIYIYVLLIYESTSRDRAKTHNGSLADKHQMWRYLQHRGWGRTKAEEARCLRGCKLLAYL